MQGVSVRTSYAIQKGVMETLVGGVFNRFMQTRIRARRNTLFFEEITANYVKECEKAGYGKEIYELGREWFCLIFPNLFTKQVRMLPWNILINGVLAAAWKTLGATDEMHVDKKENLLIGISVNSSITRYIGKNMLYPGLITGIYEVVFNKKIKYIKQAVEGKKAIYHHRILDEPPEIYPSRPKEEYDRLNKLEPVEGFTLQDALEKGIFRMRGNRIYFRGKGIWQVENTLFHLIGQRGILLERVPEISRKFFAEVLEENSGEEEKLQLLKTLLQVMGWGVVSITKGRGRTVVEIKNPPHGFQKGKDDYGFLARVILGFMQNLDAAYGLGKVRVRGNAVSMEYLRQEARGAAPRPRG